MELMSPMWYKKAFWGCAWVWQDGCMCTKGSTQNIYISSDEKLQFQQSTSDPSTAPSILGMWFLFWLGYSSWDRKSLAEWLSLCHARQRASGTSGWYYPCLVLIMSGIYSRGQDQKPSKHTCLYLSCRNYSWKCNASKTGLVFNIYWEDFITK